MAVEYGSGSISFSGLGSDVKFDEMIDKLYKIESRHAQQLLRWKSDWNERTLAFADLRKELTSFRATLGSLNSVDKFLVKDAHTSNASVVAATPKANALEGAYRVEVNRLATVGSWSLDTTITDKNTVLNDTDTPGEFAYTYKGTQYKVAIPKGTTLEGLRNLVNNNSGQTGVKASLIQSADGIVFQIRGMDTGNKATLTVDNVDGMTGLSFSTQLPWTQAGNTYLIDKPFASYTSSINDSGKTQTFNYSLNGVAQTVDIANGASLLDMANAINAKTPGAAEIYKVNEQYFLQMRPTAAPRPVDAKTANFAALETTAANATDIIPADTYSFVIDQGLATEQTVSVTTNGSSTLQDLVDQINGQVPDAASLKSDGNGKFTLSVAPTVVAPAIPNATGSFGLLDWRVTQAQDAQVRVNGWPGDGKWLETSTNTIDDVVEGVSFNVRSEGEAIVTVSINTSEIIKNVQKFVDAMNSVRTKITEMTKVDSAKKPADPNYASSQFDMQKGSVLTGNYGVQLISSRLKQAIAGQGKGFLYSSKNTNNTFSGDPFASLSQIGILTNVDQGNPNYGLLEFFKESDNRGAVSLEAALKANPKAIAELFAADNLASTESPHFKHNSHIIGSTKPGAYEIEYSILPDGTIDPATAKINGKQAVVYQDTKQIGLGKSDPPTDADGLFIDVYDLDPTPSTNPKKGILTIKQGKINELISMLDGEEGMLGSKKGALGILETNYKEIMGNIDKKLKLEDERLIKWTRTTRNRFARLEGVLASYNARNEGLKDQIKQLGSK